MRSRRERALPWFVYVSSLLVFSLLVGEVRADDADVSRADRLFRGGKERLAAGDFAHACPMLAESYRLDPATGGLLALAVCHEREGRLASAFKEFSEVATRSHAESRPDREQAARERVRVLDGKVSTVTIEAGQLAGLAELEIRVNHLVIPAEQLGRAVPVDGGVVLVEASARGRQPWRTSFTIFASLDARLVTIPALALAQPRSAAARPAAKSVPVAQSSPVRRDDATPGASLKWTGLSLLGAGAVGLGVGLGFGLSAMHKNDDSRSGCQGNLCTPSAHDERMQARTAGNTATVALSVGAALSVAGLVTYLYGRRAARSAHGTRRALSASPFLSAHSAGGSVQGRF